MFYLEERRVMSSSWLYLKYLGYNDPLIVNIELCLASLFHFFKKMHLLNLYGYFAYMFVCKPCAYAHKGWKRAADFPELELQTVVSNYMGAKKWNQVLCRSRQCS